MNIPFKQRGTVLLVSLIILLLMTTLSVTSFNIGKNDLQIVANMQQRKQTQLAAQEVIELSISNTKFTETPTNFIPLPCATIANRKCVDINRDGIDDITVDVTSSCAVVSIIPINSLDFSNPDDAGCLVGLNQNFGVVGAVNGDSLCADAMWSVKAVATDSITEAQYSIEQGVNIRVSKSVSCL